MDSTELAEYLTETDDTAYYELLIVDDDRAWWACNLDGHEIDLNTGCPEHAPHGIAGLHQVECDAEPRHAPMWVVDGDHCGYGVPCPQCVYAGVAADLAKATRRDRCYHWGWHRWTVTRFAVRWAYRLGVISGSTHSWGGGLKDGSGCDGCVTFRFDLHPRPYVLGASRDVWRCWLRGHRRGEPVGFGECGKCMPWPCCGSVREGHADGCVEDFDRQAVSA